MAEKVIIGKAELWLGDCWEVLPLIKADAVITDHPYGISYVSKGRYKCLIMIYNQY